MELVSEMVQECVLGGGGERGNADILQVDVHNILNNYLSMEGSMKARQIQLHPCIQYTCTSSYRLR